MFLSDLDFSVLILKINLISVLLGSDAWFLPPSGGATGWGWTNVPNEVVWCRTCFVSWRSSEGSRWKTQRQEETETGTGAEIHVTGKGWVQMEAVNHPLPVFLHRHADEDEDIRYQIRGVVTCVWDRFTPGPQTAISWSKYLLHTHTHTHTEMWETKHWS